MRISEAKGDTTVALIVSKRLSWVWKAYILAHDPHDCQKFYIRKEIRFRNTTGNSSIDACGSVCRPKLSTTSLRPSKLKFDTEGSCESLLETSTPAESISVRLIVECITDGLRDVVDNFGRQTDPQASIDEIPGAKDYPARNLYPS
jgi:hypothetical protein